MPKTKHILSGVILGGALIISFFIVEGTLAQADIQYPVVELGNCRNETECRAFCDKPANITVCVDFAEKHNLMSEEEADVARKFVAAGAEGPGGCTSQESCEAYCNDVNHIDECIAYAEENGLIPPDELEEAKKVQAALRQGARLPGGCTSKAACDIYCEDPNHMEECIAFAEAAGFIPPDELAEAKQALQAVRKGVKPPPCRGREACDAYCGEPEHFEECMTFAEAAGFMTAEEAQMARKTGGKGPGDCRGKEECESFCNNPANGEICFNFAKEHGLISEEELQEMEEGKAQMREVLDQAPPEVMNCLSNAVGAEAIEKLKAGTGMPSQAIGDNMRTCFEEMMGPPGEMPSGMPPGMPPGGEEGMPGRMMPVVGPGGCKTPEECRTYCENNPQECERPVIFQEDGQPPGGMMPFGEGGMPPGFEGGPQDQGPFPGSFPGGQPSPEQLQQFQEQYQQQFEQQFQQEYQEQFQQQFQEQYQQMGPPPDGGGESPQGRGPFDLLFGTILAPFLMISAQ